MTKKATTKTSSTPENIYLHNVTDNVVEIDGRKVEPGDAISVSPKLKKEAREVGLE